MLGWNCHGQDTLDKWSGVDFRLIVGPSYSGSTRIKQCSGCAPGGRHACRRAEFDARRMARRGPPTSGHGIARLLTLPFHLSRPPDTLHSGRLPDVCGSCNATRLQLDQVIAQEHGSVPLARTAEVIFVKVRPRGGCRTLRPVWLREHCARTAGAYMGGWRRTTDNTRPRGTAPAPWQRGAVDI